MTIVRQIEADDCCCDGRVLKTPLIPVDEAGAIIGGAGRAVERIEHVTLENAVGRILAEPVAAKASVPPFDNSAMDGYAVRHGDFVGEGPWSFPIAGSVAAGHAPDAKLPSAAVVQILTGAPIPCGADTVVPQENVSVSDSCAVFTARPKPGCHVRYRGEDLDPGQLVVPGGCWLAGAEIAALAASGHRQVPVTGRVRVAVVATGDELRNAGDTLAGATIWDVNSPMLRGALHAAGAELVEVSSVIDDRSSMAAELRRLAPSCDVIVTTGGISVGEKDFVKPAVSDAGGRIVFSGVAMKPGKPVSFGKIGHTCWLGLPGNPYAALVAWTLFGSTLIDARGGRSGPRQTAVPAVTATRLSHPTGRAEFRLAHAGGFDEQGRMVVSCAGATHSARVSGLPGADGIVEIPQGVEEVPAGGMVRFWSF